MRVKIHSIEDYHDILQENIDTDRAEIYYKTNKKLKILKYFVQLHMLNK